MICFFCSLGSSDIHPCSHYGIPRHGSITVNLLYWTVIWLISIWGPYQSTAVNTLGTSATPPPTSLGKHLGKGLLCCRQSTNGTSLVNVTDTAPFTPPPAVHDVLLLQTLADNCTVMASKLNQTRRWESRSRVPSVCILSLTHEVKQRYLSG